MNDKLTAASGLHRPYEATSKQRQNGACHSEGGKDLHRMHASNGGPVEVTMSRQSCFVFRCLIVDPVSHANDAI